MRIAVFLPNWIGDVVMATPAIRALRQQFPEARIAAVCRPYVAAVIDGSPWIDEVILWNKSGPREHRFWSVVRQLKQVPTDVAVLFPNSFRPALLSWFAGCKRRIGFARYWRSMLLTDRLQPVRDDRGRLQPAPVIDDYNRLVAPLGIDSPGHRMELFTTKGDEAAADRLWDRFDFADANEVVGLNPGAAFGSAKHWPIESFVKLARRMVDERGARVLVLCGPNERETAREIAIKTDRPGVDSLAEESVSLGLSKACVRRLDLLVTTDSGPRHFAAAFDVPVVSLFGPTFIDWTVTYFEKETCLQKKVPCGPCQLRTCPLDHRCMMELSPEEVFAAGRELLNRFSPQREVRRAG